MPPKVLYFPLLTIPSGHEKVADAVHRWLTRAIPDIEGKKVEALSAVHPRVGEWVTSAYLRWIKASPGTYDWLYRRMALPMERKGRRTFRFRIVFMHRLREILREEKPDLIVATHAFPSSLLSALKRKGELTVPVVNLYTDFFVNRWWGRDGIDLHFLPSEGEARRLMSDGVPRDRIYVTGIPVDPLFVLSAREKPRIRERPNILVAGGSIGAGLEEDWGDEEDFSGSAFFLCGRNKEAYERIAARNDPRYIPLPYLDSRDEMNRLYDMADAIVTKPGGVTVSEALWKGVPIFIHSSLPAQEMENLRFLTEEGLALPLQRGKPVLSQVGHTLQEGEGEAWWARRTRYVGSLEWEAGLRELLRFFQ